MRQLTPVLLFVLCACDTAEPPPNQNTQRRPLCGDGLLDAGEACDDGNGLPTDGCSAACQVEPGHAFEGAPDGLGGVPDLISQEDLPLVIHATGNPGGVPDSFFLTDLTFDFVNAQFSVTVTDEEGGCDLGAQVFIQDGQQDTTGQVNTLSGECANLSALVREGQFNRLAVSVSGARNYLVVISL